MPVNTHTACVCSQHVQTLPPLPQLPPPPPPPLPPCRGCRHKWVTLAASPGKCAGCRMAFRWEGRRPARGCSRRWGAARERRGLQAPCNSNCGLYTTGSARCGLRCGAGGGCSSGRIPPAGAAASHLGFAAPLLKQRHPAGFDCRCAPESAFYETCHIVLPALPARSQPRLLPAACIFPQPAACTFAISCLLCPCRMASVMCQSPAWSAVLHSCIGLNSAQLEAGRQQQGTAVKRQGRGMEGGGRALRGGSSGAVQCAGRRCKGNCWSESHRVGSFSMLRLVVQSRVGS